MPAEAIETGSEEEKQKMAELCLQAPTPDPQFSFKFSSHYRFTPPTCY